MSVRNLYPSLILVLLSSGCGAIFKDPGPADVAPETTEEADYALCGRDFSEDEFMEFMNGNLVFVANQSERGASASDMVTGLVFGMLLNGIDFSELDQYTISFESSTGTYAITNNADGTGISLILTWAQDFNGNEAGTPIQYNVFELSSYLTDANVSISWQGINTTASYSYGQGPLYGLIDSSITMEGTDVSSINASFSLKTEYISFAVSSSGIYNGQAPRENDTLTLVMTTTEAALDELNSLFAAGGYGLSYDGTIYDSEYYGIDQTMENSVFYIKRDDEGLYYWEGTFDSDVTKGETTYYQHGLASQRQQNYTQYYCEDARSTLVGTAYHATDLSSGYFEFADGTRFDYGLEDF